MIHDLYIITTQVMCFLLINSTFFMTSVAAPLVVAKTTKRKEGPNEFPPC